MDQDLEDQRRTLTTALRERGATDDTIQGAVEVLARGWPTDLDAMFADELLAEALRSFAVHPAWFERRMTGLRRRLLFAPDTLNAGPLLAALAIQCQLNEYAWAEDGAEAHEADRLLARLETLTAEQVMAVACYRRLADHPAADALLAKGWTGPVAEVLGELIVAEREEREISTGLAGLTPIRDGVSSDVRSQYEVNPYPRWRRVPRPDPAWSINGHPVPVRPRVLVAGCGTGRQAIQAHLWLAAEHTLAVDLSRRSLSYAVRKTRESGITGIEYAHGDILELPQHLPEAFDVVTCVGVLHHMSDPFEGARAVCRTLKPGGLLNIGLYSRTARTWLRPARTFAERFTPETVRELRQAVLAAPRGDLLGWPATSRDFYTTSGARDPLMHVQEHQMGFADLRRILDENDLRFMGFIVSEATMAAYRAAFPHDPEGLDLGAWERFETMNPRVFARMYSFWAEKPAAPQPSSATVDTEALPPTLEGWRAPGARRAVLADLRRGVLGVQPPARPAVAHLRTNWPATDAALAADELLAAVLKATPAYPY